MSVLFPIFLYILSYDLRDGALGDMQRIPMPNMVTCEKVAKETVRAKSVLLFCGGKEHHRFVSGQWDKKSGS